MPKLGTAVLTALMLATTPLAAAEMQVPHRIARDAAWGCRDKSDLLDLLFLGISTSFDSKLATALAEGRCIYFKPGEDVMVLDPGEKGIVRVQRGGVAPAVYWTSSRNVK